MKKSLVLLAALALGASAANADNTMAVTAGGADSSNFKLAISCDPSGTASNNVFVESAHPTDEAHYLIRFWINPGLVAMDANKAVRIGAVGDDSAGQHLILFLKRNDADNSYRLNTWYNTDVSGFTPGPGVFLVGQGNQNQWRQVEVEFTAGAGSGEIAVRRIAPTQATPPAVTGLDNDGRQADNFRWGTLSGSCVNAAAGTGAFYLDEFESYR